MSLRSIVPGSKGLQMSTRRKGKHCRPRQRRRHLPVAAGSATLTVAVIGSLTMSSAGAAGALTDTTSALQAPSRPSVETAAALGPADPFARITSATQSLTRATEQASTAGHREIRQAEKKHKAAERERKRQVAAQRAAREADERARLAAMYTKPMDAYTVATQYGTRGSVWSRGYHTGLDLLSSYGTPIKAVHSGEVTFSGWDGAYGNKIEITHPDGTQTWYAHMSSTAVGLGPVSTGQVIGYVGSTGNSYGNHLHLEARDAGGGELNPYTWLQQKGITL
jgi:murein DD-endopeptidase MepM/ murein hydrolase activator NlpD